jgi:hypothetical protein
MEVHLGMCGIMPSCSPMLPGVYVTFGLHSPPAPFHALALVMSPKLTLASRPRQRLAKVQAKSEA